MLAGAFCYRTYLFLWQGHAEGRLASTIFLVGHDALDDVSFALFGAQEFKDSAFPCPDVGEEFLQAFDAAVGEGSEAFLGT